MLQVYLPRVAFDRISTDIVRTSAERLGYDSRLHWRTSTHAIPNRVPANSIRLDCGVTEATVFLLCLSELSDEARAAGDTDVMTAIAEAAAVLAVGVERLRARARV